MDSAFKAVVKFNAVALQPCAPVAVPSGAEAAQLATWAAMLEVVRDSAIGKEGVSALRVRLMCEELAETIRALQAGNEQALADGLVDLVYVVLGTGFVYDLPLAHVWHEVHAANMRKFPRCTACGGAGRSAGGLEAEGVAVLDDLRFALVACTACAGTGQVLQRDATGKVQKPAGWQAPAVAEALAAGRMAGQAPSALRAAPPARAAEPDVERARQCLRTGLKDERWMDGKEAAEELRTAIEGALRALDGEEE